MFSIGSIAEMLSPSDEPSAMCGPMTGSAEATNDESARVEIRKRQRRFLTLSNVRELLII